MQAESGASLELGTGESLGGAKGSGPRSRTDWGMQQGDGQQPNHLNVCPAKWTSHRTLMI